ncbi:hypothetical protein AB0J81_13565 [Streptomyces bobili]|uniref:hypothetical protein n=1 Tax=Streptomyces bobili TaxID=67280 RepID=UPI003442C92C
MYARGGRVAVAAGAAALTLLVGPGAWAAQEEPGAGAGTEAGAGSGAGAGAGVSAPVLEAEPAPGADAEPAPGTEPAPGAEPGTGIKPAPGGTAADPVDVISRVEPDSTITAPGRPLGVRAIADVDKGAVKKLGLKLSLPTGVTYVKDIDDASNGVCTPAADGRSVTCVPDAGGDLALLSAYVELKVGDGVAPGTVLEFTSVADIGDAVDSKPENNTATEKVTVKPSTDLGIEWTTAPKGPVKTGTDVPTEVTVTNHGPGTARLDAVHFEMGFDNWPVKDPGQPMCWADPGVMVCEVNKDLAPGESVELAFTWRFLPKAAGTQYRVPTRIYTSSPLDANRANDKTELVFDIKRGTASPSPTPSGTPTPSASPTPTASPSSAPSPAGGGGQIAATGAGVPVAGLAAGAGALVLAGGALVARRRRSS